MELVEPSQSDCRRSHVISNLELVQNLINVKRKLARLGVLMFEVTMHRRSCLWIYDPVHFLVAITPHPQIFKYSLAPAQQTAGTETQIPPINSTPFAKGVSSHSDESSRGLAELRPLIDLP
jgi:hypothetical protein